MINTFNLHVSIWASEEAYVNLISSLKFAHELIPLSTAVFLAGLAGFLESREFLSLLVNTEVMMLGINFHLITDSVLWGDYHGQAYALCFLAITAAETAIGLSILVLLYRVKGEIFFGTSSTLKG